MPVHSPPQKPMTRKLTEPGRADAAQGHHAQRVADDRRIDQRIHLLQQKSKQHRDRELPDIPQRLAGRQIMRHGADLLCTCFCHEH